MRLLIFILVIIPITAIADGHVPEGDYEKKLMETFKEAQKSIPKTELPQRAEKEGAKNRAYQEIKEPQSASKLLRALNRKLDRFNETIDNATNEYILTKSYRENNVQPLDSLNIGAKVVYDYEEGKIYTIYAAPNRIVDIELGRGERLTTELPISADTKLWRYDTFISGVGKNEREHIVVKPRRAGIETNFILPTNRGVYHLHLVSGTSYSPFVSFFYPEDDLKIKQRKKEEKQKTKTLALQKTEINEGYVITGDDPIWKPLHVFDDGVKTYILMPDKMKVTDAPTVFALDKDDNPMLVNYQMKEFTLPVDSLSKEDLPLAARHNLSGTYYILDKLVERAEMRLGKDQRVKIVSDRYKRTFLEVLFGV